MRRSANGWTAALALSLLAAAGCSAPPPRWGAAAVASPACPRDAARDPSSERCECIGETVALLGACVPLSIGDSFCGAAARIGRDGCTFRSCGESEVLDIASGSCIALAGGRGEGARGALPETAVRCPVKAAGLIENGQAVCVPADTACPRGTLRGGGQAGSPCVRPPRCPPGTLLERSDPRGVWGLCRPLTTSAARNGHRVDVGAWVAIAFGIEEGPGSPELCRPLAQRPSLFGLAPGQILAVRIRIAVTIPDQDLARLHAEVTGVGGAGRSASLAASAAIERAVATLLEPLRSLGGESSTASVETSVTCEAVRLPEGP